MCTQVVKIIKTNGFEMTQIITKNKILLRILTREQVRAAMPRNTDEFYSF